MTLHIINKTSAALELNEQISNAIEANDQVLLIEDAVLQALCPSPSNWQEKASKIYVLEDDAIARGLQIPESVMRIDYNGFVSLTIEHKKVVSWY